MTSRFDLAKPKGRTLALGFPIRRGALRDPEFPHEHIVAEPAVWPAASADERAWLARPIRAAKDALVRVAGALQRLIDIVEGQPLVWTVIEAGWVQRYRAGKAIFVYEGEITPAIKRMFAEHPERFEHCAPALLYTLRLGN